MGLLKTTRHFHTHDNSVNIEFPRTIEVNEHKAPTDESVRLLNEFQDKAKKNIIATIKIDENYLKGIAIYYQGDYPSNRIIYHLRFELNGKEYRVEDYIDGFEWKQELSKNYIGLGNEIIFKSLHKKFSKVIANELMKQCPDFSKAITG